VQLESECKTPSLAHRLSAVKRKGLDPSFQQQKKHNRSSAPAPEAPSGSSDYKKKGKGKTCCAFRGGKKNKQQHFHSHITDAMLIDIPPTIVFNPIPSKSIFPTVQTAHDNCSDLENPRPLTILRPSRNLLCLEQPLQRQCLTLQKKTLALGL